MGLKKEALEREPPHYLFVNTKGLRFGPWHFSRKLRKTINEVLGRKKGSVHVFRHGALTEMVQHADIETVRQIAGHANLATTQRYLDSNVDRKLGALTRGGTVALVTTENGDTAS